MERENSLQLLADLETTKKTLEEIRDESKGIMQSKLALAEVSLRIGTLCENLNSALEVEKKIFDEIHSISVSETLKKLEELNKEFQSSNEKFSNELNDCIDNVNNSLADNRESFDNQLQEINTKNTDFLSKISLILDKNISDLNSAINSLKLDNAKTINDLRELLDKKTSETMNEMRRFNKRVTLTALVFTIVGFLCGVIALVIAIMK